MTSLTQGNNKTGRRLSAGLIVPLCREVDDRVRTINILQCDLHDLTASAACIAQDHEHGEITIKERTSLCFWMICIGSITIRNLVAPSVPGSPQELHKLIIW
jgi:hypothetical protein